MPPLIAEADVAASRPRARDGSFQQLDTHQQRNWGYAGDLAAVVEKLQETVNFLG